MIRSIEERNRLVVENTGIVHVIAQRYRGHGLPLDDIVQEGKLGLMRAAEKYDPDTGWKFTTYAGWWIRSYIRRAVYRDRAVRIPDWAINKRAEIRRQIQLNRDRGSYSDETVLDDVIASTCDKGQTSLRTLHWLVNQSLLETSLDASPSWVDDPDSPNLHGLLENSQALDPEEECRRLELNRILDSAMDKLAQTSKGRRQVNIIRERLARRTLAQIGKRFGITRERVRQIEKRAIEELREIIGVDLQKVS